MASVGRDHIGPYRCLKMIQVGNATQIWQAINSTDHQRVAIKIPRDDCALDKGILSELKHEYEVARSLDHPGIVHVYELNYVRRVPYLVMEYFPAPNLKQCLRQDTDKVHQYLPQIVLQSAEAIEHLHDHGWVHRDLKPENLLLGEGGQVKLIDFAIASRIPKGLSRLWKPKTLIQGTRSYISPEQIRGELPDVRSDIYSFGCTLYFLLAGKVPYTGTSADELLSKHLRGSVPAVAAENANVTPEFNQLVSSMMARRIQDRPQSMSELLDRLRTMKILKSDRRTVRDAAAQS